MTLDPHFLLRQFKQNLILHIDITPLDHSITCGNTEIIHVWCYVSVSCNGSYPLCRKHNYRLSNHLPYSCCSGFDCPSFCQHYQLLKFTMHWINVTCATCVDRPTRKCAFINILFTSSSKNTTIRSDMPGGRHCPTWLKIVCICSADNIFLVALIEQQKIN